MPDTALTKERLIDQLVKTVGLRQEDAAKTIDHVISELVFAKPGSLLADQNCQCCGGARAAQ